MAHKKVPHETTLEQERFAFTEEEFLRLERISNALIGIEDLTENERHADVRNILIPLNNQFEETLKVVLRRHGYPTRGVR